MTGVQTCALPILEEEVREIQRETAALPPLKVLVLEGHPSRYLVSFDPRWLIGDFLRTLGSRMIPDVPFRGVERLLLLDPDVIFVEYFDDNTAAFIEELRRDPKYNALRAVQNQRVYPLPVHLMYMPGPRTAEGLRYIAHALYPHLDRSEEHTSELQSRINLVCRLLLEKKNDECNATGSC